MPPVWALTASAPWPQPPGSGSSLAFVEDSGTWISGAFIAASVAFGIDFIIHVLGVLWAGLVKGMMAAVIFIGALIFSGAAAIPSARGLYVAAAAAIAVCVAIGMALWPEVAPQ